MKIDKSKYTGYLWYSSSDQKEPQVLNNEDFELEIDDKKNPFIIEGQLFNGEKSISIKYVNGKYIVKEYILSEMKGEKEELSFYANRMGVHKKMQFLQYWREDDDVDNLCEGMKALQPKELVFVGFND